MQVFQVLLKLNKTSFQLTFVRKVKNEILYKTHSVKISLEFTGENSKEDNPEKALITSDVCLSDPDYVMQSPVDGLRGLPYLV